MKTDYLKELKQCAIHDVMHSCRLKEYGGFNHFIAGKIFRWKYCYLSIALRKQWRFEWIHESDDYYYDGYHNSITIGCLQISYGT